MMAEEAWPQGWGQELTLMGHLFQAFPYHVEAHVIALTLQMRKWREGEGNGLCEVSKASELEDGESKLLRSCSF